MCVGALLKPESTAAINASFLQSLGLAVGAPAEEVFAQLRLDTPKHKLHEPDRLRYERAFEAFVDAQWDADFAIGGLSPDGVLDAKRGYLFVGVRVDGFEITVPTLPRGAAAPERPQWLKQGDLSPGSDLSKALGPDARKTWEHAARSYQRAAKDILKDAIERTKKLPISTQHDVDWALCRWIVDAEHESVQHRHGRMR